MKFIIFLCLLFLSTKCTNLDIENNNKVEIKNKEESQIVTTISVDEFYKMVEESKNNKNIVIIDLRTENEYNNGHIENAINIDFYNLSLTDILNKLNKDKTYLIYCRSGNRSGKTLPIMKDLGFKKVYNMEGGILLWSSRGYPIVKKD